MCSPQLQKCIPINTIYRALNELKIHFGIPYSLLKRYEFRKEQFRINCPSRIELTNVWCGSIDIINKLKVSVPLLDCLGILSVQFLHPVVMCHVKVVQYENITRHWNLTSSEETVSARSRRRNTLWTGHNSSKFLQISQPKLVNKDNTCFKQDSTKRQKWKEGAKHFYVSEFETFHIHPPTWQSWCPLSTVWIQTARISQLSPVLIKESDRSSNIYERNHSSWMHSLLNCYRD